MKILVVAETLCPCGGGEFAMYLYVVGLIRHDDDVRVLMKRICGFDK